MRPSAHGRLIGQVRRVFAVRCGLLGSITGGDVFTGLLPAGKAVVASWRQPIRQGGEGLSAWSTDSTPHPNAFVLIIVTLTQPPPVADDRVITANRTSPRQEVQSDPPRISLVFGFWQCDKKNHGWREGRR
jgi:hypothetical protein